MWSDLEKYPRLLSHVLQVERIDDDRFLWRVEMLGTVDWESINDGWVENRRIAWRSVDDRAENRGCILFEEDPAHPNTTLLTIELAVRPLAGAHVAAAAAAAEAAFEAQLRDDLEAFAESVEALVTERPDRKLPSIVRGSDRSEAKLFDPSR
jgi:uncharacterized membrane protein